MGLGPVSSQPQAASMLVAGFSSQESNGPLWSYSVSLPSASVRMQLRCHKRASQDTELDSHGGQGLLPRPQSKEAAYYPSTWLVDWSLCHFHWLIRIKQFVAKKTLFNFSNDPWVLVPTKQQIREWKTGKKQKVKECRTKKEQPFSTSQQPKCR